MTDFDPEAPGRGPARLDCTYVFEVVQRPPIIGVFIGVAIGVRKGRDRLFVEVNDDDVVEIPYEDLISTHRIGECPNCGAQRYARYKTRDWRCFACQFRGKTDPTPATAREHSQYRRHRQRMANQ